MKIDTHRRIVVAALLATLVPPRALAARTALCPSDVAISDPIGPLTIDTHAHFFNGSDLPVREFLAQTTVGADSELYPLVKGLGGILQLIAWRAAPDANAERRAIKRYAALLKKCEGHAPEPIVAEDSFQEGYILGRRELQSASKALRRTTNGVSVLAPKDGGSEVSDVIANLPASFSEFQAQSGQPASVLNSQPDLLGYLNFVLHQFNYRHINAIDYLTTYSKNSSRKVDLVVANMVDYDYWLTRGRPTPTSLSEQVEMMGQISALLGGRTHGFVSYCPFRETMTRDGNGVGDSLRLVRKAIELNGFIGVKLYPPMGFAAYGNTGRSEWKGKKTLLRVVDDPNFGGRLDSAMQSLFEYCLKNDVPIMAHTNNSNGPYKEFRELAGSTYWEKALTKFPGLRVSFGHFGDTDVEDNSGVRTQKFLHLMSREASTPGLNTFADSGYFAGAMMDQGKMEEALIALYSSENRIMLDRFMYGSDWTMILQEKNSNRYLSDFIKVMEGIEKTEPGLQVRKKSLANAFFGTNAVEYLGLAKGRKNRARLEVFYSRHEISTPDWMRKVDRD